ncbi:dickkopf-related protein 1b [Narcine bancroftii]|uniref:dickkopf-related protein 1b n=1 Tax=Narcine bancroftii TaxID=1343680 RepID=UPI0038311170
MYWEVVLVTVCFSGAGSSFNSNAIKTGSGAVHGAGYTASVTPQIPVQYGAHLNHAIEQLQFSICWEDQDCAVDQFCPSSRPGGQHCLNCRRRRKRCARDAMCCPGARCNNGICISNDGEHLQEGTLLESWQATLGTHPRRTTLPARSNPVKSQEGDVCLRSSDCAQGLCCARHFWSKICKPVLRDGQVCTKHKRKGSHGLEIFQRCDCAQGLSCRIQKGGDLGVGKSSRLHACQ